MSLSGSIADPERSYNAGALIGREIFANLFGVSLDIFGIFHIRITSQIVMMFLSFMHFWNHLCLLFLFSPFLISQFCHGYFLNLQIMGQPCPAQFHGFPKNQMGPWQGCLSPGSALALVDDCWLFGFVDIKDGGAVKPYQAWLLLFWWMCSWHQSVSGISSGLKSCERQEASLIRTTEDREVVT